MTIIGVKIRAEKKYIYTWPQIMERLHDEEEEKGKKKKKKREGEKTQ